MLECFNSFSLLIQEREDYIMLFLLSHKGVDVVDVQKTWVLSSSQLFWATFLLS